MPRTTFACPDCGEALSVAESAAGREVRCVGCGAPVEVPFLPRAATSRRRRTRSETPPWTLKAAWGVCGLFAVVLLVGLGIKVVRSRAEAGRAARVGELLDSAGRLEKAGRLDRAFIEAEAALALAAGEPIRPETLERTRAARDRISLADARRTLGGVDRMDHRRAVGECLTLRVRAERDRALAPLAASIEEALARSRLRQTKADQAAAAAAFAAGRAGECLGLLEGIHAVVGTLPAPLASGPESDARGLAKRLIGLHGVNVDPIRGQFLLGSTASYESAFAPAIADALKLKGFLRRPARSPYLDLWDQAAYRLSIDVSEIHTGFYLQSRNRLAEIRAGLRLTRGPERVWLGEITARTRVPLDGLPALVASRLAVSDKRLPEAERRLYDDAFAAFSEQFSIKLRGLPAPSRP